MSLAQWSRKQTAAAAVSARNLCARWVPVWWRQVLLGLPRSSFRSSFRLRWHVYPRIRIPASAVHLGHVGHHGHEDRKGNDYDYDYAPTCHPNHRRRH
jgi:hypothetical protein